MFGYRPGKDHVSPTKALLKMVFLSPGGICSCSSLGGKYDESSLIMDHPKDKRKDHGVLTVGFETGIQDN